MSDGMKLDDYVKETLLGIVRAVVAAQEDPSVGQYVGRANSQPNDQDDSRNSITQVSFDLATTVEESGTTAGGGSVRVIPFFKAEMSGNSSENQSTVSRISFAIPIGIPRPDAQRQEDSEREQERRRNAQLPSARTIGHGAWMGS